MSAPQTLTVEIRLHGERIQVEGRVVVPGLAITPTEGDYYSITHIASGQALIQGRCAKHIEAAAELVVAAGGIDWTRDAKTVAADAAVKALTLDIVHDVGLCGRRCDADAYDGPSWQVRCNTCHWEWDDEYDDGPLDAKAAKRIARDHDCEPDVELSPPNDSNEWFAAWLVNNDGTVGNKADGAP